MFRSGVGGLGGVGCCLFVGLVFIFAWRGIAVPVVLGSWEVVVWSLVGLLFCLFGILRADGAWQGTVAKFQTSAMATKI